MEKVRNRYCKVSTSEHLACPRRNDPTEALIELYRNWRGYGLVITGNVMVDRRALEAPRNVVLDEATDKSLMKAWAEACDGITLVQLSHPGRQSPLASSWKRPLAPATGALRLSGVGVQLHRAPRLATTTEVSEIISNFGISTRLAREAGFDGIQIHAAHGYFLSHCLSLGMLEILFDTIDTVRRNLDGGLLSVKINAFQDTIDTVTLIRQLKARGVHLVELSPGGSYSTGMRCLGDPKDFDARLADPIGTVLKAVLTGENSVPAILISGDMPMKQHKLLEKYPDLYIGYARAACLFPDLSCLFDAIRTGTIPQPPPFFRSFTDALPLAIRRIFIPGLRFGWYQRQIRRIARKQAIQVHQGHAVYLITIFPRVLFFEPARLLSNFKFDDDHWKPPLIFFITLGSFLLLLRK